MIVEKLTSLNPTRYREMEIADALESYKDFIQRYIEIERDEKRYGHGRTKPSTIISFEEWLLNEI